MLKTKPSLFMFLLPIMWFGCTNQLSPKQNGNGQASNEQDAAPTVGPDGQPLVVVPNNLPTLVERYQISYGLRTPLWNEMRYRPRGFFSGSQVDPLAAGQVVSDAGDFANWDVLNAPNQGARGVDDSEWLWLQLNRPAKIAVALRHSDAPQAWLNGWQAAKAVKVGGSTLRTFVKNFEAGEVKLGGVWDPGKANGGRDAYYVLLAEADGQPTTVPLQPEGQTPALPNESCPPWAHDRFVTKGPDGNVYRTWHPPVDPVYWCYFHHEHGSNPKYFSGKVKPLFGYTAQQLHEGFKVYVLNDNAAQIDWMVTHHFGTGSITRVCEINHVTDVAVSSQKTGDVLADVHVFADYGPALANVNSAALQPEACPEQQAQALAQPNTYAGVRKFPVDTIRDPDGILPGYEPWSVNGAGVKVGVDLTGFSINTHDGQTICNSIQCNKAIATGAMGTARDFVANMSVSSAMTSGEFFTDVYGKTIAAQGAAGALRQYVKPDVAATMSGHADNENGQYTHAWGGPVKYFTINATQSFYFADMNVENSLKIPN